MDIGYSFSISPIPLKGIHKDPLNIHELIWDVKMEIWIFPKPKKLIAAKLKINLHNNYIQDIYFKYLAHETTQIPNCVIEYFNNKPNEKLIEIINSQLFSSLKKERA